MSYMIIKVPIQCYINQIKRWNTVNYTSNQHKLINPQKFIQAIHLLTVRHEPILRNNALRYYEHVLHRSLRSVIVIILAALG